MVVNQGRQDIGSVLAYYFLDILRFKAGPYCINTNGALFDAGWTRLLKETAKV